MVWVVGFCVCAETCNSNLKNEVGFKEASAAWGLGF